MFFTGSLQGASHVQAHLPCSLWFSISPKTLTDSYSSLPLKYFNFLSFLWKIVCFIDKTMGQERDANQNKHAKPLLVQMNGRLFDVAQFAGKHPGGEKVSLYSRFSSFCPIGTAKVSRRDHRRIYAGREEDPRGETRTLGGRLQDVGEVRRQTISQGRGPGRFEDETCRRTRYWTRRMASCRGLAHWGRTTGHGYTSHTRARYDSSTRTSSRV